jgi:DNA-binding response OmpR family regulator
MELPRVLSLSTDPDPSTLRERARVLQLRGFEVVSVTSPSQAQLEITMGHCGIFVSCPLLSELSTAELFRLFKNQCPDGLSVFVIRDETRSSVYRQQADIQIHESYGPEGIVAAIFAHLRRSSEPTDWAQTG